MRIGYGRISRDDQNLALQRDALRRAGCDQVFFDQGVSGRKADRPALKKALAALRSGDMLVVWRLDRLGRSLFHLVVTMEELNRRDVGFQSLCESIDTTTAGGKLVFHIFAAIAEFELALIVERTIAGMEAARARGKHVGRPPRLTNEQIEYAWIQIELGKDTIAGLATRYGVSAKTLSRALKRYYG